MSRKHKKYHYIYKTTHIASGRFYIGMHSTDNLEDGYMGSGKRIRNIINKYGKESCSFEILEHFSDRKSLASGEKEIVNGELLKNPLCINLTTGGHGSWFSTIGTVVVKDESGCIFRVNKNDDRYTSGTLKSICKGTVSVRNKNGKFLRVDINDIRYASGEFVHARKGLVVVKDVDGNITSISKNDPRYLSGELVHHLKGHANFKDIDGNITSISKNDIRYLSGDFVGATKGFIHSNESKKHMSFLKLGDKNPQYGTIWITNLETGISKKIHKDDYIPKGWFKGRKIKEII